jgi:predicted nucleic acid-binding protein
VIVVDTSVWIEFFRKGTGETTKALQDLLTRDQVALAAPVYIELLSGSSQRDVGRLRRLLSALPQWMTTDRTWPTLESWAVTAAARGDHFGVGDLLVAGIAAERGAALWSLDGDFVRMASLGFVDLFVP